MQMGEAMGDKTYENRETAIAVKNVSKVYKLYDKPMDRLKEALRLTRKQKYHESHALSDVSFEIKRFRQIDYSKDYHRGAQSLRRQCRCQWAHFCAAGAGGGL